jgi:hypothetical protein
MAYSWSVLPWVLMACISGKGYLVYNSIATTTDFFGDFVIVRSQVAEVRLDFVVFISLTDLRLLVVVVVRLFILLLIGHVIKYQL